MNRGLFSGSREEVCMPHVCGDEPFVLPAILAGPIVCPTYVGMNRQETSYYDGSQGMPHVCGDEPLTDGGLSSGREYAPRMWG